MKPKINSTLCYIEKDGCYLMLFRNKKQADPCEGKWVGVGGKFEPGESAEDCLLREVKEETGLLLTSWQFCGIVHFISDTWPDEDMYLYTASGFEGAPADQFDCDEGDLKWIPKEEILHLNLWEGDRYFLEPLIAGNTDIRMTCRYEGYQLVEVNESRNRKETDYMKKFVIEMENGNTMSGELYEDIAPITVENFVKLAGEGFYNGLKFHRVIPGFMIQGGCPRGNGTGGPGYTIKGEFSSNGIANDLKHTRGVISMARAMDPDSAGSQFFIMVDDAPYLDGQYAAFGQVTDGMETADRIVNAARDVRNDCPFEDQVIKSITIEA